MNPFESVLLAVLNNSHQHFCNMSELAEIPYRPPPPYYPRDRTLSQPSQELSCTLESHVDLESLMVNGKQLGELWNQRAFIDYSLTLENQSWQQLIATYGVPITGFCIAAIMLYVRKVTEEMAWRTYDIPVWTTIMTSLASGALYSYFRFFKRRRSARVYWMGTIFLGMVVFAAGWSVLIKLFIEPNKK